MAAAVEKAIKFNLRGGDAIFVSLAREFNTSFLTFDEEVKRKIIGKIKLFEI
jgi:predicted nucleic acid-binding protein